MQAIVYREYGGPEVLSLEELPAPEPKDGEVLVRVRAAAVNPMDRHFLRGEPYFLRLMSGWRRPKSIRLGADLAVVVEAVGRGVTRFKPGDAVFGAGRGAFGELVCTPERALAVKPERVSFEQAAALPVAGTTALQGLRDAGKIQPGQTVLINGAAGGVGTFAVQIARALGAVVTGVCSTRNVELVRSLGAAHVVDYTQEDFITDDRQYDLMLDCVMNHSPAACRRVLRPRGTYVAIGGKSAGRLGPLLRLAAAAVKSSFTGQRLRFCMAKLNAADLAWLGDLVASGKITPVIDRRGSLREVPEAIRHLETGHTRGKMVISLDGRG